MGPRERHARGVCSRVRAGAQRVHGFEYLGHMSGVQQEYRGPIAKVGIRPLAPLWDGRGREDGAQDLNDGGRDLQIHGVNLSVGYPFDPSWFAAGLIGLAIVMFAASKGFLVPKDVWDFPPRERWSPRWMGTVDPGAEPEVITRGFVHLNEKDPIMVEAIDRVMASIQNPGDHISEIGLLKSQIKDSLSTFLYEQTKRRPMVFPVVVEV